jgi:diguanylate cyclase (GGDEF)-like protein/PAS domain S-box-containing protein
MEADSQIHENHQPVNPAYSFSLSLEQRTMIGPHQIVLIFLGTTNLISLFLGAYVLGLPITPVSRSFGAMLLCVFGWSLTTTIIGLSGTYEAVLFWTKIKYLMIGAVSISWFNFALRYSGYYRGNPLILISIVSVVPAVSALLIFYDHPASLVWSQIDFVWNGPVALMRVQFKPLFWILQIYNYLILLVGIGIILAETILGKKTLWRQGIFLITGAVLPFLTGLVYTLRLIPGLPFDITMIGFTLGGVFLAFGLFHFRVLQILPVAYRQVVQSVPVGVIVLDLEDRVVTINPFAQTILAASAQAVNGKSIRTLFPEWNRLREQLRAAEGRPVLLDPAVGGEGAFYDMTLNRFHAYQSDSPEGWILILRDITEQQQRREILEEQVTLQTRDLQIANEKLLCEIQDRQRAQEAVKKERDLFSHLVDISPIGIVMIDAMGAISFANQEAANIVGLTVDDLLGPFARIDQWNIRDLSGEPTRFITVADTGATGFNRKVEHLLFNLELVQGKEIQIEVNAVPQFDSNGVFTGILATISDISERAQNEKRLMHLATHDLLTNLPNRGTFNRSLEKAIEQAELNGGQFAVLFIDVDDFKSFNDAFFHSNGDDLLRTVANRLTGSVRAGDTVARYSGDEFAILLDNINDSKELDSIVQRILKRISDPIQFQKMELVITASIGVALYPQHGTDPQKLIQRADMAMYHAKRTGKRNSMIYDPDKALNFYEKFGLMSDLRYAIKRDELVLHYQPIVDLSGGEIHSMEALVRWNHPLLGLLQPKDFISLAEENDLIIPLGNWVLHEACRQGREWLNQGLPPQKIRVNISEKQLGGDLIEQVQKALNETGFPAELLEIELSEDAMYSKILDTGGLLEHLRQMGVKIAIDDFGTSRTSLKQLAVPYFDTLKLDRTLTQSIERDRRMRAIVIGLIKTAEYLNLEVVAEGVETRSQLDFYHQMGCVNIQGYYFFKPLAAENIPELLGRPVEGLSTG